MTKPTYIDVAGVLSTDAEGNLIVGGRPMNSTDPRHMPPSLLRQEMKDLEDLPRPMTSREKARYEDLFNEELKKNAIRREAAEADARKDGARRRQEDNQRRLDRQSLRAKGIVSRRNSGDLVDRSDAVKARHARLKQAK